VSKYIAQVWFKSDLMFQMNFSLKQKISVKFFFNLVLAEYSIVNRVLRLNRSVTLLFILNWVLKQSLV